MKTVTKLFLALCLVMGFGAAMAARAQIESDATIEANIPYAFVVRDTTLPAGKYSIKVADAFADLNVLEIRSQDGRTAVLFDTDSIQPDRAPGKTELVFNKIGDQYFLSQIFLEGDDSGNQVIKSRMEKKLEDNGRNAERQSVAANRSKASKSVGKKVS